MNQCEMARKVFSQNVRNLRFAIPPISNHGENQPAIAGKRWSGHPIRSPAYGGRWAPQTISPAGRRC